MREYEPFRYPVPCPVDVTCKPSGDSITKPDLLIRSSSIPWLAIAKEFVTFEGYRDVNYNIYKHLKHAYQYIGTDLEGDSLENTRVSRSSMRAEEDQANTVGRRASRNTQQQQQQHHSSKRSRKEAEDENDEEEDEEEDENEDGDENEDDEDDEEQNNADDDDDDDDEEDEEIEDGDEEGEDNEEEQEDGHDEPPRKLGKFSTSNPNLMEVWAPAFKLVTSISPTASSSNKQKKIYKGNSNSSSSTNNNSNDGQYEDDDNDYEKDDDEDISDEKMLSRHETVLLNMREKWAEISKLKQELRGEPKCGIGRGGNGTMKIINLRKAPGKKGVLKSTTSNGSMSINSENSGGVRKRGRPPRYVYELPPPPPPPQPQQQEGLAS